MMKRERNHKEERGYGGEERRERAQCPDAIFAHMYSLQTQSGNWEL